MEGKTMADFWEWMVLLLVSVDNLAVMHRGCKSWEESQTVLC